MLGLDAWLADLRSLRSMTAQLQGCKGCRQYGLMSNSMACCCVVACNTQLHPCIMGDG